MKSCASKKSFGDERHFRLCVDEKQLQDGAGIGLFSVEIFYLR
jgi:hypothetical protein